MAIWFPGSVFHAVRGVKESLERWSITPQVSENNAPVVCCALSGLCMLRACWLSMLEASATNEGKHELGFKFLLMSPRKGSLLYPQNFLCQ